MEEQLLRLSLQSFFVFVLAASLIIIKALAGLSCLKCLFFGKDIDLRKRLRYNFNI